MNLIELFNAFQETSERLELGANARSLYFAILAEFNKRQYPSELVLSNVLLQHLSGVKSSHSFDSARNALINAKLIRHSKQRYTLGKVAESAGKDSGKTAESLRKDSLLFNSVYSNRVEKEKEKEKTNNNNNDSAGARESVERYLASSRTIAQAWQMANGEYPHGYDDRWLLELETRYGAEKLKEAIETAAASNTAARISINYVRAILERRAANVGDNADSGGSPRDNQYYGGDDICEG